MKAGSTIEARGVIATSRGQHNAPDHGCGPAIHAPLSREATVSVGKADAIRQSSSHPDDPPISHLDKACGMQALTASHTEHLATGSGETVPRS